MRGAIRILLSATLALLVLCAMGGEPRAAGAPAFLIVVHPDNPGGPLDRKFVEDAFLKKIASWPNGDVVHPADLAPDSPTRRVFTHDVLNRSVEAVKGYWQQRIFSGRDVPPPEFSRDEEVIEYVLRHPGGIGYVSGSTRVGGCKVVALQ